MIHNRYNSTPLLYTFELDTPDELTAVLAANLNRRRLERGLSRQALSLMSGVPIATIAKFERQHTIALTSFVALSQALGYTDSIKGLLAQPRYSTMQELEQIKKNSKRKRGRNEFGG